jgi:lysine 2,3-aminomutase
LASRHLSVAFVDIIGDGDGGTKLARLLDACGYSRNPKGFSRVARTAGQSRRHPPIVVNGIELPHLLLMAILEVVLPGNKFVSIKTTEQLEKVANIRIPEADRADMQKVIDTYPVRLSMHTIRQMRVSGNVAYQYLPFVEELDNTGHTNTWIGQFHQGLLEQMYQNRVIFLLNMSCPVYCRFCFRKHKESRNETNPTPADVESARSIMWRNSPSIKEIVITGGDPFMNRANMACAIDGLMEVDHVQTLRLATRSIAYYPHLFLSDDAELLGYLKRKNLDLQARGKRMEVATHFIHPDEISPQSLSIITELVKSGIAVYVQTPFLNNCNDEGPNWSGCSACCAGPGRNCTISTSPAAPSMATAYTGRRFQKDWPWATTCGRTCPTASSPDLHGHPHRQDGLAYQRLGRGTGGGKRKFHVDSNALHPRLFQTVCAHCQRSGEYPGQR